MKIVNIVPGFGGTFYCGNCLRDSGFVKSLKSIGHDAMLLPIYLPLSASAEQSLNDTPVFYGAVNIYLKQKFRFLRHMPTWLHRFFDSRPILNYAAKKAGSTRADGLEDMTVSMLEGSKGFQAEELHQLVEFLKHVEKPDVVHLSNALLLGLAEKLKTELQIPIVCSLQDEDVWVDAMEPEFRLKVWQLMSDNGKFVDHFVAVSDYFAGVMKQNMNIPENKIHVVPIGVNPENFNYDTPNIKTPVIGYLSRMCEENGFEIVVDAFIALKLKPGFENVRLRVSGGKTADDNRLIRKQVDKLKKQGLFQQVDIVYDYIPENNPAFFKGLTMLSVPVLKGEAFGLYQLESLASGIPIVQPALGAFPEIAEKTGGGFIYAPNTSEALAGAWAEMLQNPDKLLKMSKNGRRRVEELYDNKLLSEKMVDVYLNAARFK